MFKVNNTNTRMTSTLVPFEQANVGWEDTKQQSIIATRQCVTTSRPSRCNNVLTTLFHDAALLSLFFIIVIAMFAHNFYY